MVGVGSMYKGAIIVLFQQGLEESKEIIQTNIWGAAGGGAFEVKRITLTKALWLKCVQYIQGTARR